ncbi:hypothetical protein TNIN_229871 [Trichonephila inaurata madagascariensis]|uniref:Uncharacterized protein n=1 Tax=Trichonephila inaurata madagascariensis TaxID=2747483 RepID=A0A8X6XIR8_9ARAC|nr:hypothetical protein TNIN_229871 [Trichonephila inaurata madagascariensis]
MYKQQKRRQDARGGSLHHGPRGRKGRGLEDQKREMNKNGLSSSATFNCPLKKRLRKCKESLQQGRASLYNLRPRNKVTKEAGSRPSGRAMPVQGDQSGPEENRLGGQTLTTPTAGAESKERKIHTKQAPENATCFSSVSLFITLKMNRFAYALLLSLDRKKKLFLPRKIFFPI